MVRFIAIAVNKLINFGVSLNNAYSHVMNLCCLLFTSLNGFEAITPSVLPAKAQYGPDDSHQALQLHPVAIVTVNNTITDTEFVGKYDHRQCHHSPGAWPRE